MSVLINTLKAEHANILEMLESVYALGPTTEDGHNRLMAAKNGLMAHLKREDDELYPVLLKAAQGDPALKETLATFSSEMSEVSVLALEFFAKHCLPTTEKEFAVEYEKFANLLMQRIEKEESVIYAYYDQLLRRD